MVLPARPRPDRSAFQRGEDLVVPFLLRDETGGIVNVAAGALAVEVWWRGARRILVEAGPRLVVLDPQPPAATDGAVQAPHGTVRLSAAETATIPAGRSAQIRTRFIDAAGRTYLSSFQWLEDAAAGAALTAELGGRQGPAGAPVLTVASFAAVPLTGPAAPRLVLVDADETNGLATTLYLQDGPALA